MNSKKMSWFQFHFLGLLATSTLGLSPVSNYEKKISGKVLEAMGSKIGTDLVFCHSFSVSKNVSQIYPKYAL